MPKARGLALTLETGDGHEERIAVEWGLCCDAEAAKERPSLI